MTERAVTLMEIFIVMIITSITTLLSVQYYQRVVEKTRAKTAQYNLGMIYNKQMRYNLDNGSYFICSPCTLAALNTGLELNVEDGFFTYAIQASAQGYTATATRNAVGGGGCSARTITVSDASSDLVKGCSYW